VCVVVLQVKSARIAHENFRNAFARAERNDHAAGILELPNDPRAGGVANGGDKRVVGSQLPERTLPVTGTRGDRQTRKGSIGGEHSAKNTNPPRRALRDWSGRPHITTAYRHRRAGSRSAGNRTKRPCH
jgi:hypothetical protein